MKGSGALLTLLTLVAAPYALATPVSFSFASAPGGSSTTGGQISFSGDALKASAGTSTFSFLNATGGTGNGYTFDITSATGEPALNTLFGTIGGAWTIGAVTTSGGTDSANVTAGNPGTFRVYQDSTDYVEAQISFFAIKTFLSCSGGGVSGNGTLNVSGWTTTGTITNTGLMDLISEASGKSSVSFTFSPGQTLSQIVTGGQQSTSFSGSLATMPEPSELAFLGVDFSGLGVLFFLFRRRKTVDKGV